MNFQNNSSPAPVSSSWNFNDGTISSQINPVKTFLIGGTYQVKLLITMEIVKTPLQKL